MAARKKQTSKSSNPTCRDFAHTGPDTLAGRYLRMFWQPVYYSQNLQPGQVVPIRIMNEDFTLYRGEGGDPHIVAFRCAHRGTQLSAGWVEGDCIRCYYHGWMYDATGQCVAQPAEPQPFASKVRIGAYPTQEYIGLVFAYLGEGPPPPLPRYPEFENFDGVLEISDHAWVRECNFFNNVENVVDFSHVGFVHRTHKASYDGFVQNPNLSFTESEWGITIASKYPNGQLYISQFGMPNRAHLYTMPYDKEIVGWVENLFWWVPIDDESFQQFGISRINLFGEAGDRYRERQAKRRAKRDLDGNQLAAAILAGKVRQKDIEADRVFLTSLQDHVAQIGQGRIADREHERLGQSDVGIIFMRKLWGRELKAFAERRPCKQWTKPPSLGIRYPGQPE